MIPLSLVVPLALHWFQVPADRPNWNMVYSLAIAGLGFGLAAFLGRYIIRLLKHYKIGKQVSIYELAELVKTKTGTPTMGGIIFVLTAFLLTLVFNLYERLSMLLPLGVLLCCGVLGAIDDKMSLVGSKQSEGMKARFKFAWLFLFAAVTAVILYWPLGLHHANLPIFGRFDIGLAYIPIAIFGIIGTAHAVNLTDGLDALAGGTSAIAFVAYGIIAYIQGQVGVVTFCFIMVGSLLGFLWHNAHPAQVFMGDLGSLALGASLATAAFMTGQWVLLPIIGFIFVAVTLSVIFQIGYFKLTRGQRLLKRSPLHRHFQMSGWSETQVTMRFWLIGIMAGLFGVALALL